MLPLRAVSEAVGAKVDWDADRKTAGITTGETKTEETKPEKDDTNKDSSENEIELVPGVSVEIVDPNTDDPNITEIIID